MEYDAVRLINYDFWSVHYNGSLCHVDIKESHCIGLMVKRYKVLVIREECCILRILS
jgi:hypothetical protein